MKVMNWTRENAFLVNSAGERFILVGEAWRGRRQKPKICQKKINRLIDIGFPKIRNPRIKIGQSREALPLWIGQCLLQGFLL